MRDPLTRGARMTHGGPCARRVRHGEPLHTRLSTQQFPTLNGVEGE